MAQMAQVQHGTYDEEFDYDLFPLAPAGIGVASGSGTVALTNVVADGFTLKLARLTFTGIGVTCYVKLQIVATGAGVVDAQGVATQTVFDWELPGTSSAFWSEDQLEITVPAGFQLFATVVGANGTVNITGHARYVSGGFT